MDQFVRNIDTLFSEIGNDIVALDVARGECFGMTDVAAEVWRMLENPVGLSELCARLRVQYDVEEKECRADVADLLRNMVAKGLVRQL